MFNDSPKIDLYKFIEANTIRYKFVLVLFILCILIFNQKTSSSIKTFTSFSKNGNLIIQSLLFSIIVYLMLKISGDSFILSPCNIEMELNDFIGIIEEEEKRLMN